MQCRIWNDTGLSQFVDRSLHIIDDKQTTSQVGLYLQFFHEQRCDSTFTWMQIQNERVGSL